MSSHVQASVGAAATFGLAPVPLPLLTSSSSPLADPSPSHLRRPWWPAVSGWGVWLLSFLSSSSLEFSPQRWARSLRWSSACLFAFSPWWRGRGSYGSGVFSLNNDAAALIYFIKVNSFLFSCPHGDGWGSGWIPMCGLLLCCGFSSDPSFRRDVCSSLFCLKISRSFLVLDPVMVMVVMLMRFKMLQDVVGDRGQLRRWIWRSHGAHGCLPVFYNDPIDSLAEWRHSTFLLAKMLHRRRCCFSTESIAWCYGVHKWFCPPCR